MSTIRYQFAESAQRLTGENPREVLEAFAACLMRDGGDLHVAKVFKLVAKVDNSMSLTDAAKNVPEVFTEAVVNSGLSLRAAAENVPEAVVDETLDALNYIKEADLRGLTPEQHDEMRYALQVMTCVRVLREFADVVIEDKDPIGLLETGNSDVHYLAMERVHKRLEMVVEDTQYLAMERMRARQLEMVVEDTHGLAMERMRARLKEVAGMITREFAESAQRLVGENPNEVLGALAACLVRDDGDLHVAKVFKLVAKVDNSMSLTDAAEYVPEVFTEAVVKTFGNETLHDLDYIKEADLRGQHDEMRYALQVMTCVRVLREFADVVVEDKDPIGLLETGNSDAHYIAMEMVHKRLKMVVVA